MIIFQSLLLISLLHVVDQDINQQIGCPRLINGTVGQNITLKCTCICPLEEKLVNVFLNWTLKNESSGLLKQVHVFRNEGDDETSQHVDYQNRTSVFPEQFKHGNISLELANVTKKDQGIYTWTVYTNNILFKSGNITLHVVENGSQVNWTGDINQQTGCPRLIYGTLGQNITLKCTLKKKLDNIFLNWTLKNESSGLLKQVHVFRNEGDDEKSQHADYKKRTSVFPEQFKHGNISLELANVTKKDQGTYTWTVYINNLFCNSGNITLYVADKNETEENLTGGETKNTVATIDVCILVILIIVGILVILVIAAVVVYKQRDKIRDWYNSKRNRPHPVAVEDDGNGEGGHAEENDPPVNADVNPEQVPLNVIEHN